MKLRKPFYDPAKTYEENFHEGPFAEMADGEVFEQIGEPTYNFHGNNIYLPFGIAAGPLVNGRYVKAALDKGFDLPIYKTVRTKPYPCNPWPNVVPVQVNGNLTIEQSRAGLVIKDTYTSPLAITNSFGVPSFDPDFWQKDMAEAVRYAKKGQVVIGSFQGTTNPEGDTQKYIQDFATAARLVKETGAKVLEVNLSCPNEGTAHLLCFDIERTRQVVEAIKNEIGDTPLMIKTAYYETDEQLEKLLEAVGKSVQGIASINTIPSRIIDKDGNQALPGKGREISGVCGEPIRWAGLDMVKRLKKFREEKGYEFKIEGVGGVTSVEDYKSYREAGADSVMSVTGVMWNSLLAQEIKEALA